MASSAGVSTVLFGFFGRAAAAHLRHLRTVAFTAVAGENWPDWYAWTLGSEEQASCGRCREERLP